MGKITWEPVDPKTIEDKCCTDKYAKMWREANSVMKQRTANFQMFTEISHNRPLIKKPRADQFSEGSTQAIKRKIRAQTIQRVPDGEVITQFDKNSIEQAEIEFLFKNKILTSEYDRRDMMKNLWRTFNASYDYGFACVRTGFERDLDGDVRITYKHIPWNDVYPAPDCDFIEEANWYMIREYISQSDLWELVDCETGTVSDPTYNEDVVHYLLETDTKSGREFQSQALQDREKGADKIQSIEVRTLYAEGADEFITFVPSCSAVLRRVKNEDPRKSVPLHFLILEPDPEFPLGCSSVLWTLAQQQFADAFQTGAYEQLLLACNPPLMIFGNLTPAKVKMKPNAAWPMGTNPNNKIEKFPIENTTIVQYGSILENISGNMMKNLNVSDATIASDAKVARYSATPQGVEAQQKDKTVTVNQYQKRVEIFFSEWANHALRSYLASMSGEVELTVDEETRRKIWDIELARDQKAQDMGEEPGGTIINENKIKIDFDALSTDMLEFKVRTGSLIENQKETERKNIQELLVPISQMLGNVSDDNRGAFEDVVMKLVKRLCEASDVDVSASTAGTIDQAMMKKAMVATMETVMQQQQQIDSLAGMAMGGQQPQPEGEMPPEELPMAQEGGEPLPPIEAPTEQMPME